MQSLLQRLLLGNAGGGGGGNPTLNYNFVDGSAFPSAITFTRGSNATQFDSSGNLVYAPVNLEQYSEDFTNLFWTPANATVSGNAAVSPNNTTTADKLITTNALTGGQIFTTTPLAALSDFTFSVFAKASEWGWLRLTTRGPENSDIGAYFDLSNGVVGTTDAGVTAAIQLVGNGWYRCAVTRTTGTGAAAARQRIYATNADNVLSTGDGTSGIFIWGAQLNPTPMLGGVTASLSTYYPTTTTAYYGPRLDYDPATLAARGLLIEEQRTNSLLRSAEFDNASWVKTRATVTANTAVAPDGTTSADSLVEDGTAANTHDLRQGGVVNSATTTWTLSFFLKAVNRTWALIELQNATSTGNRARAWFNLQTGVVGTGNTAGSGVTYVSHSIQNVGNGWYRCVVVGTVDVSVTNIQSWVEGTIADNTSNYDGVNGQTSIYIWGAQLEAGAFPTSYIPTTTTALTRNADVASVNTLSPWYNASEGTLFAEVGSAPVNTILQVAYELNDNLGGGLGRISTRRTASQIVSTAVTSGGVVQSDISVGTVIAAGATYKVASAFKTNDFAITNDGLTPVTSSSGTLPNTIAKLFLGQNYLGGQSLNGYLRRITYYPVRLTNAALQQITT